MKHDVIIGVGSNINAAVNIEKAVDKMKEKFFEIKLSRFIETEPLGFKDQSNFLNGAVRFKTALNQENLKKWLFSVESDLGRIRTANKNGPRPIDLDILVWNEEIIDEDVYERDFLQTSINELSPGLVQKNAKNKH